MKPNTLAALAVLILLVLFAAITPPAQRMIWKPLLNLPQAEQSTPENTKKESERKRNEIKAVRSSKSGETIIVSFNGKHHAKDVLDGDYLEGLCAYGLDGAPTPITENGSTEGLIVTCRSKPAVPQ